ncbi:MAG: cohesin domain-containing protein [Gallionella sp.]|nr:cohesin domain-containing protein [Gallionella sp.]
MSTRFASAFVALLLGVCLHAPSALAQLSVTATQATGEPGQGVDVTLTLGGGTSNEVDLSAISAYTFNFLWDPAVLSYQGSYESYDENNNFVDLSASLPTAGTGSLIFAWTSDGSTASFADGLNIKVFFDILLDAPYGPSTIAFGDSLGDSVLFDENFNLFSFSNVNDGGPMQVTVASTSPVPEPAEISMMLAGLGMMALVLRRRRRQG